MNAAPTSFAFGDEELWMARAGRAGHGGTFDFLS